MLQTLPTAAGTAPVPPTPQTVHTTPSIKVYWTLHEPPALHLPEDGTCGWHMARYLQHPDSPPPPFRLQDPHDRHQYSLWLTHLADTLLTTLPRTARHVVNITRTLVAWLTTTPDLMYPLTTPDQPRRERWMCSQDLLTIPHCPKPYSITTTTGLEQQVLYDSQFPQAQIHFTLPQVEQLVTRTVFASLRQHHFCPTKL